MESHSLNVLEEFFREVTNIDLDIGEHQLTYLELEKCPSRTKEALLENWSRSKPARERRSLLEAHLDNELYQAAPPPPPFKGHAILVDLLSDAETYLDKVRQVHELSNPDEKIVEARDTLIPTLEAILRYLRVATNKIEDSNVEETIDASS